MQAKAHKKMTRHHRPDGKTQSRGFAETLYVLLQPTEVAFHNPTSQIHDNREWANFHDSDFSLKMGLRWKRRYIWYKVSKYCKVCWNVTIFLGFEV